MDELLDLVRTLQKRIGEHGVALGQNEAMTRLVLVDPLLRGLGWDTEDPSQVVPEYGIPSRPSKSADYALFTGNDVPEVIIEAKKLGESLADAAHQAVTYCTVDGYRCFAVTDGRRWAVYETLKPGVLEEKRVARFDIGADALIEVCLKAMSLWRQRFVNGASTHVTSGAVLAPPPQNPGVGESEVLPSGQTDTSSEWTRLSEPLLSQRLDLK